MASIEDTAHLAEIVLQSSPTCRLLLDNRLTVRAAWGDCRPLFGATATELRGRNFSDFAAPHERPLWQDRVARAFARQTVFLRESRGEKHYLLAVFPLVEGTQPVRLAALSAMEATPWGNAEQELRQAVLRVIQSNRFEHGRFAQFLHDDVGRT